MQNILFSTISKKSFWACLFGLIFAFCSGTQALAYKTEQIWKACPPPPSNRLRKNAVQCV
jgi:hypothetical protein